MICFEETKKNQQNWRGKSCTLLTVSTGFVLQLFQIALYNFGFQSSEHQAQYTMKKGCLYFIKPSNNVGRRSVVTESKTSKLRKKSATFGALFCSATVLSWNTSHHSRKKKLIQSCSWTYMEFILWKIEKKDVKKNLTHIFAKKKLEKCSGFALETNLKFCTNSKI